MRTSRSGYQPGHQPGHPPGHPPYYQLSPTHPPFSWRTQSSFRLRAPLVSVRFDMRLLNRTFQLLRNINISLNLLFTQHPKDNDKPTLHLESLFAEG